MKAGAILQMCIYSEQVAAIQGREPDQIHVVLGDMSKHSYRLRDYSAYYRSLKARFESTVLTERVDTTYPEPVGHCNVCRWSDVCDQRRRKDDHLSLVARMRGEQIRKLQALGIATVVELAQSSGSVAGMGATTVDGLRNQARLAGRAAGDWDGKLRAAAAAAWQRSVTATSTFARRSLLRHGRRPVRRGWRD